MSEHTPHTNKRQKPTALEGFNLSFEYNQTWSEAKKSVKERTK